MNLQSLYLEHGLGGVEVLILHLAYLTAINCVAELAAKALYVKVCGAHANLLIGIESHANLTVLYLGMLLQILYGGYYLGNSAACANAGSG